MIIIIYCIIKDDYGRAYIVSEKVTEALLIDFQWKSEKKKILKNIGFISSYFVILFVVQKKTSILKKQN